MNKAGIPCDQSLLTPMVYVFALCTIIPYASYAHCTDHRQVHFGALVYNWGGLHYDDMWWWPLIIFKTIIILRASVHESHEILCDI